MRSSRREASNPRTTPSGSSSSDGPPDGKTGGSRNVYDGGGDGIFHSKEDAFQGFMPASLPLVLDLITFNKVRKNPVARMNAPTVMSKFRLDQPSPG